MWFKVEDPSQRRHYYSNHSGNRDGFDSMGSGAPSHNTALAAICASVLALVGAAFGDEPFALDSSVSPTDLTGDVQVWGWNIAAASLDKLVPPFNEIYPKVRVHVNMTGANLQSRFLLSLSAGVGAPDISQLQLAEAARYSRTRRLTDLTEVARKYEKDFPASFWKNCVFEGKVYAVPWDMGPCAVFYKRDLFARHEIDPASIETWDDYIAAGKLLLERSGGRVKMLALGTGNMEGLFEILLQQNGGQMFDDEDRIAISSLQARRVMSVIRKILEAGISANLTPYAHAFYSSFTTELVATYPSAAWFGGTIKDYAPGTSGNWGVFRLPAMEPGGLRTSNLGGSVLVIPDQCPQKAAAWAFIEYTLCTREAQIEQYRNFDLFPAFLPTHSDPFFDAPDPFYGGQKVRRLFSQDIERIPPLNRTKDWFEALRYLTQSLSKWYADGMGSTEDFLAQLEDKLSRRLGRDIAPREPSEGS